VESKVSILKSKLMHGVTPALATPLESDGYTVNTAVIPQLVEFLIEAGVSGLFVGGTTGEGILLDVPQRKRLHEAATKAANDSHAFAGTGRLPVILHIGGNRIDTAVTLAKHAAELKVDAIAAVTPYYYGVPVEGLISYYRAIAAAAPDLPLLLYDIPHMAINGITAVSMQTLIQEVPTISGIKTSRRNVDSVRQIIDAAPESFIVLAGAESAALGTLALGADGLISGLSTAVPEPFVALTKAVAEGNLAAARRHQQKINQILACLPAGKRIGAIKVILAERGIEMGTAVPPRPMPNAGIWPAMQAILKKQ